MLTRELEHIWITSDGRKFLSEKEAKMHEQEYKIAKEQEYWKERQKEEFIEITQSIKEKKEKIKWLEKQQQNLK
tara:strand:- start:1099 stop:1320 length:222 start_codon:yes stop_codon:yes gene_type:complete